MAAIGRHGDGQTALIRVITEKTYRVAMNLTIKKDSEAFAVNPFGIFGAPCPTRTDHLLITNQLLYQMS